MGTARHRFDAKSVLEFILDPRNKRRIIWSPGTTLHVMDIEQYPHDPPTRYRKMKRILEELHAEGYLKQRARFHSRFTLKEVAYERSQAPRVVAK